MRLPPAAVRHLCLALLVCGCNAGTVVAPGLGAGASPGGGGGPDAERISFEGEVLPLLDLRCASCHRDERVAPAFMGPDVYDTIMGWPNLVTPGDPARSSLVTHGIHRGPAWQPAEQRIVSGWIVQEGGPPPAADAGTPALDPDAGASGSTSSGLQTSPTSVVEGRYQLDLSPLGLEGTRFTFTATRVALGLHMSDLAIQTGARAVHVVHPRLVTWVDGRPVPDPGDPFAGVELTVPADSVSTISTSLILVDFPNPGALGVRFDAAATR